MTNTNKIIVKISVCFAGIVLTLIGMIGFFSFIGTKNYIHTVGVVEQYNRKRVYKYRKTRYESTMVISYKTDKYGTLYTTLKSYYPFRKVGDKMPLWYDADKPRDIKLPFSDSILYIFSTVLGLGLISFGIYILKK